jgi:hypothetical protein
MYCRCDNFSIQDEDDLAEVIERRLGRDMPERGRKRSGRIRDDEIIRRSGGRA